MSEGITRTFDRLHLSSLMDGDWRRDQQGMQGLALLTPYLFIGSNNLDDVTVEGYYNCANLAQYRVSVRQVRTKSSNVVAADGTLDPALIGEDRASYRSIACPNMFDLDTRHLYTYQLNSNPADNIAKHFGITYDNWEWPPKGQNPIRGLPVRLQQVHFRGFNPQGESDEYAAYFLCSNPVGPSSAYGVRRDARLPPWNMPTNNPTLQTVYRTSKTPPFQDDEDIILSSAALPRYWTYNSYTRMRQTSPPNSRAAETARRDFEGRLVIGDSFRVRTLHGPGPCENVDPLTGWGEWPNNWPYDGPNWMNPGNKAFSNLSPEPDRFTSCHPDSPHKQYWLGLCPNPMNNCYELIVDTKGLGLSMGKTPETARGWKYAAGMTAVITNKFNLAPPQIEDPHVIGGKYICDSKPGWTIPGSEGKLKKDDHVILLSRNQCAPCVEDDPRDVCQGKPSGTKVPGEEVKSLILIRPDPLPTVETAKEFDDECLLPAGDCKYLGYPGYPSASALGSLDGKRWEAVPLLQLDDFCNAPHVFANDLMTIPVLENCLGEPESLDVNSPLSLTPCETTLGKVCLQDLTHYIIDYLFKTIENVPQEDDLPWNVVPPPRGLVTRVHATDCAVVYDYITARGTPGGDPLGFRGTIDGLAKYFNTNQVVIPFALCETPCTESPGNAPGLDGSRYQRCIIGDPVEDPYTIPAPGGGGTGCTEEQEEEEARVLPCNQEFLGPAEMFTPNDSDAQTCTEERTKACPEGE